MIYDLITGVGLEPGQMMMYVCMYMCKMSESLRSWWPVMPNTVKPCLQK